MVTALYASILAILICYLTINVIKNRRKHRIRYADGDNRELQVARSAHSNAVETIPIALILLFFLEYNGAPFWLINCIGIIFITGRLIHAHGILSESLKRRVLGMQLTFWCIICMAFLNPVFIPWQTLSSI